jgi:hypothetical protein
MRRGMDRPPMYDDRASRRAVHARSARSCCSKETGREAVICHLGLCREDHRTPGRLTDKADCVTAAEPTFQSTRKRSKSNQKPLETYQMGTAND